MKKVFYILSLSFMTNILTYGQLSKGSILFDFTGSYIESINNSGVQISSYYGKTKTFDMDVSAGISFSNSFIAGIGLEYATGKDLRNYFFEYYKHFAIAEQLEIKTRIISPLLFLKYYKQITGKLYFSANLSATYGFVNSRYSSIDTGSALASTTDYTATDDQDFLIERNYSNKVNYLGLVLEPELNYFLTKTLGLIVKFGGIKYNSYNFDDHEWKISINPSNWTYGFILRLGKER